jgi:hypothetical protein
MGAKSEGRPISSSSKDQQSQPNADALKALARLLARQAALEHVSRKESGHDEE